MKRVRETHRIFCKVSWSMIRILKWFTSLAISEEYSAPGSGAPSQKHFCCWIYLKLTFSFSRYTTVISYWGDQHNVIKRFFAVLRSWCECYQPAEKSFSFESLTLSTSHLIECVSMADVLFQLLDCPHVFPVTSLDGGAVITAGCFQDGDKVAFWAWIVYCKSLTVLTQLLYWFKEWLIRLLYMRPIGFCQPW